MAEVQVTHGLGHDTGSVVPLSLYPEAGEQIPFVGTLLVGQLVHVVEFVQVLQV